jgi:hypothetical protein
VLFGDAQVAGERAFEAAAHRIAVDRRNRDHARILQRLERGTEALRHQSCLDLVAVREILEVRAGAEKFIALAGDDDGAQTAGFAFSEAMISLKPSRPAAVNVLAGGLLIVSTAIDPSIWQSIMADTAARRELRSSRLPL